MLNFTANFASSCISSGPSRADRTGVFSINRGSEARSSIIRPGSSSGIKVTYALLTVQRNKIERKCSRPELARKAFKL